MPKDKEKLKQAKEKYRVSEKGKQTESRYNTPERRKVHSQASLWTKRKRLWGVTEEIYVALLEKQNNSCAICGKSQSYEKRTFAVDHDHKTNAVRGLLCFKCNIVLGHVEDNIKTLEACIEYLKKSQ